MLRSEGDSDLNWADELRNPRSLIGVSSLGCRPFSSLTMCPEWASWIEEEKANISSILVAWTFQTTWSRMDGFPWLEVPCPKLACQPRVTCEKKRQCWLWRRGLLCGLQEMLSAKELPAVSVLPHVMTRLHEKFLVLLHYIPSYTLNPFSSTRNTEMLLNCTRIQTWIFPQT